MFFGRSFIYDGTPSERFGLYIGDIDGDSINRAMGNTSMEILEQKIWRNPTPYFFGGTPSPKLSFPFSAYSEEELDAIDFEVIQKWLFSSRTYKKFQIDQPDIQDIYFNAILQEPEILRVGNLIKGFSCTVECNSPFAFKYPQITTYSYSNNIVVDSTETYYNLSDDVGSYLYPTTLVVTMNNSGGNFSITNLDDSSRIVSFTGLSTNEILTISPLYQTLSSSSGLKRLSNSNKKFLRLIPNKNRLRIQGNVSSIVMTNTWIAKRIAG